MRLSARSARPLPRRHQEQGRLVDAGWSARDALSSRLARPRRRPDVQVVPQPQAVQPGPSRRARSIARGATGHRPTSAGSSTRVPGTRRGAAWKRSTSRGFHDPPFASSASNIRRWKGVLDGARHGRAHGRSDPRALRSSSSETYWTPTADFPRPQPNPLLEENRRFCDKVARPCRPRIAGTATPTLLLIDDTGRFVEGISHRVLAEHLLVKQPVGRSSTTRAPRARPNTVEGAGGTATSTAWATRSSSPDARRGSDLRRESPALLLPRLSTPTPGRSRRCFILENFGRGGSSRAARPYRSRYFISGEITPRSPTGRPRCASRGALRGRAHHNVDGLSVD